MNLLVRYQPVGKSWMEFELEEGVKINNQRNKASSCNVALPRTYATENASGYGKLQVLLNDKYLFDGTSQDKDFSKTKIHLTGYDYLWDFSKERRMFEQGSTSLTPTEAFYQAFDSGGSFDTYFTPIWGETYGAPWLAGYNASKFVVPADTAATYGDPFWDCNNKSGMDFMKQLADVCYRGDKYKYYYWYENIKGTKYLFFEPDGWGKTWKNMDYTVTQKLKTKYSSIWNNVVVWGINAGGYVPHDSDFWTESDLDGWQNYTNGAGTLIVSFDNTAGFAQEGFATLKINYSSGGIADIIDIYHSLSSGANDYRYMENLATTHFYYYHDNNPDILDMYFMFTDSGNRIAYYTLGGAAAGWNEVILSGTGTNGTPGDWTAVDVGFEWDKIESLRFRITYQGTAGTRNLWVDNLYFYLNPIRSANTSTATGYDSTSAGKYGKRTPSPVNWPNITRIDDCNSLASPLVNYYKDPQYNYSVKFLNYVSFRLNENINLIKYQENLTLPIDKLSWNFKANGEIETTVNLGSPKMTLGDTLSKYSRDVIKPSKDWGQQYFVY